ncbi:hypothetical protein SNEBB_000677 [Seison nebaliae]|nr:hypothetical protein SNEBB_000677 [Seison nebaliae]
MNFSLDLATPINGQPIYAMSKEDLKNNCTNLKIEVMGNKSKRELQNIIMTALQEFDVNDLPDNLDHPKIHMVMEIRKLHNKTLSESILQIPRQKKEEVEKKLNNSTGVITTNNVQNFRTPDIPKFEVEKTFYNYAAELEDELSLKNVPESKWIQVLRLKLNSKWRAALEIYEEQQSNEITL